MKFTFYKYQGTGNDFVLFDNRKNLLSVKDTHFIKKVCDRRFGIGADGVIFLENDATVDFKMVYFNADGNQSSMCGNGGRCIVAFAKKLNMIKNKTTFNAIDGMHHATIADDGTVSLQMKDVTDVKIEEDYVFLDTGSPHHVMFENDLDSLDVKNKGAAIRYSDLYGKAGSNVNFVRQIEDDTFALRTYERGVEDETLSCGTGATAVAIAMNVLNKTNAKVINLQVQGGDLQVRFEEENKKYSNVFLIGPATLVFEGEINKDVF